MEELLKELLEKVNLFGGELRKLQEGQQSTDERLARLVTGQLEMKEKIGIVYNQTAHLTEAVDEIRIDVEKNIGCS